VSPGPNFFYYPLHPTVRETVQFIDLTPDGDAPRLVSRRWRFGDGSAATEPWPTHRFERDGDYDVELIVRTETGGLTSVTRTVRVAPAD
jgi:PKD repeat protein